jgi:hypothetical protein
MADTWGQLLVDQLDFYMANHLRPRLVGLTDEEFFWEPIDNCWSVVQGDDYLWVVEHSWPEPEPDPPPFTTIAWRLSHIAVSNLGSRANALFGDDPVPDDVDMFDDRFRPPVPGTADEAIALLEQVYTRWRDGIAGLSDAELAAPLGPRGGPYADDSLASLVLHVNRETMHHGGEIGVLRDLYRSRVVI